MPICTTKTFQLVALWLAIFAFTRPGLRGLNRWCINDVYTPLRQNNVFGIKLVVDLSQKAFPQIVFNQLIAKPTQC